MVSLYTFINLCLFPLLFLFLGGHRKTRDPNLKPLRPKFGSRPIVWKPLAYIVCVSTSDAHYKSVNKLYNVRMFRNFILSFYYYILESIVEQFWSKDTLHYCCLLYSNILREITVFMYEVYFMSHLFFTIW